MSAIRNTALVSPLPESVPESAAMQVVGQCPGDKRKISEIEEPAIKAAVGCQQISTPLPSEDGGEEVKAEEQRQEKQNQRTESLFRGLLAQGKERSSSARSTPY